MKTARSRLLAIIFTLVFALSFGACQKKKAGDGSAEGSSAVSDSDIESGMADSDSGKAMGIETVNFPYDSSILDSHGKEVLKANARILKDKPGMNLQIEGHTDERGGIQYNIALGERRANSAKTFLVDQGVEAGRLETISYGKEKPVDSGHNESAWSKNRRANFRITQQ